MKYPNSEKGIVGLYLMVLILLVSLGIASSIATGVLGQQRVIQNTKQSTQAYYAAESGIEDALYRVQNTMNLASPYVVQVGSASSTVTIPVAIGGARTITSEGDASNRVRGAEVTYRVDTDDVSFAYGAHLGNPSLSGGGLEMDHGDAKIIGNVYSNGTIFGLGVASGTAIVAGSGNEISGITVNLNAEAYDCSGATILGDLEYNFSGTNSCAVTGSTATTTAVIPTIAFPITASTIAEWRSDAEAGGIVDGGGDVTISSARTLGPGKVTGDLTVEIGETLTLTGTLWVTGDTLIDNSATVKLDPIYGDLSGTFITDGLVDIDNNAILKGTVSPSSFLLVIGTNTSMVEATPAMSIKNNTDGAILFTPNGLMVVPNNVNVVEVMAHKLLMKKATVTYDIGLADSKFTSGPSGGWVVSSWKEVE